MTLIPASSASSSRRRPGTRRRRWKAAPASSGVTAALRLRRNAPGRAEVLRRAAREGWWVAAAHLPFPGLGHLRGDGAGYVWLPASHAPLPNAG
ncbi:hypothetical protein GCM10023082_02120 [Streptomyces tremellae]|uniref:Uncharacterized protein n=1 Tax=Streptomyces tremellae TaxID=1124239 RepID=A0ABP7DQ72_9ACTN